MTSATPRASTPTSSGAELLEHHAFLSVGHDEYWSAGQRANVEAARGAGVNLAFFSGNEIFWKTRWEPSIDGCTHSLPTLVSYKETAANAKIDPSPEWTGTWRDPRFSPPADGGRPENALTGTIFTVNSYREDAISIPAAFGALRFWRNTSVAGLPAGGTATLPAGTLGHEWDEDRDNGFRPAGLMRLSSSTVAVDRYIQDYGNVYAPGTATHSLTLYRAPSGALVFGAGTVHWAWGLDDVHDVFNSNPPRPPDPRMQQATINLLADMGIQPATRQPELSPAVQTTDVAKPTSVIASPSSGAVIASGQQMTISGSATDSGGHVAGVEVSTDGGATWHPAVGTASWSYTWTAVGYGQATIRSRAVDDSGNLEVAAAGVAVSVSCPCSLWAASAQPGLAASADSAAVEVGVRSPPPPPATSAASASTRAPATPAPTPATSGATPAPCSPAPPSPPKPAAAGNKSTSTPPSPSAPAPPTSPPTTPPTATTHSTSTTSPPPTATAPSKPPPPTTASSATAPPATSPPTATKPATTGSTSSSPPRRPPTPPHPRSPAPTPAPPQPTPTPPLPSPPPSAKRSTPAPSAAAPSSSAPAPARSSQPRSPGTRSPGAQP